MSGEDFMAVVQSSPDSADSLRNMCRKRLFKRAVKQFSLETNRGLSDDDIVAAFHNADEDNSGYLSVEDVRRIMHRMDPKFPMSEIHQLMKFVDVDEDGRVDLHEFKQIFRQFEDEKAWELNNLPIKSGRLPNDIDLIWLQTKFAKIQLMEGNWNTKQIYRDKFSAT